jgi:hypothetical protein
MGAAAPTKTDSAANKGSIIEPELKVEVSLPAVSEVKRETDDAYTVPSALLTAHPEFKSIKERNLYRAVGGVRLHVTIADKFVNAKELAQLDKLEWKVSKKGRLCKDFKYLKGNGNCTDLAANSVFNKDTHAEYTNNYGFYWEPEEWTTDLDAEVQLTVTFKKDAEDKKIFADKLVPFVIKSREIKALDSKGKQTQGSDVKILEEMLWQLGISPQKSKPGYTGTRLKNSIKKKYITGTATLGGSHEVMIRRMQARTTGADYEKYNLSNSFEKVVKNSTGRLNDDVLIQLKDMWKDYYSVVSDESYKGRGTVSTAQANNANINTWLENAAHIWQTGMTTINTTDVQPSYTLTKHNEVLTTSGISASDLNYTQAKLLEAWALTESHTQWGPNHRMYLGGADEEGSTGFNQIIWRYKYSKEPCSVLDRSDLNFYDPEENLKAFVVHTAAKFTLPKGEVRCGGGFWHSYVSDLRGMKRVYSDTSLKGYSHGAGAITTVETSSTNGKKCQLSSVPAACEGEYEVLAKSIAFYNGEKIVREWPGKSWPEILKSTVKATVASLQAKSADNNMRYCYNCYYSIKVREHFNLPKRTYIWEGAAEVPENPATPELEYKAAWCFAYGETEWVAGKKFSKVRQGAADYNSDGIKQTPVGRANCN